ncbi:uncharacterized protein LOC131224301 [Magnolia sinica]|uniref:uncharacterized protein LOC131224301 n=1 Tax=Magnolia sinica TaxID=86752 RepID=UPI00265AA561|nr:uncharacterized protein LOC131224301 [Magnolia sinica]
MDADSIYLGSNDVPSLLNNYDWGCKELVPTAQSKVDRHLCRAQQVIPDLVGKKSRKPSTHLLTLRQRSGESLKDYISRFNEEALQVDDYSNKMTLSAMINGLKEGRFLFSIGKNPPSTLGKRQRDEAPQHADKRRSDDNASRTGGRVGGPRANSARTLLQYVSREDLLDIRDQRDQDLIHKGHLRQCVKEKRQTQKDDHPRKAAKEATEIRTIYGGPSSGRDSNWAHKAHYRNTDPEHYIYSAKGPMTEFRVSTYNLMFTEDDTHGIQQPHDDALVVAMTIANHKVYRILVDIGSSADILYSKAFDKMGIDRSRLRLVNTPLHGFAGDKVIFEGVISLPIIAVEGQN